MTREEVGLAYQTGLSALAESHRRSITCEEEQRLTGSVNLDQALQENSNHADKNRWDYGIGYVPPQGNEKAIWIEAHSATEKEVSTILKKHQWLLDWLNSETEMLRKITVEDASGGSFYWLGIRGVFISKRSPSLKRLAKRGIRLAKNLDLD